MRDLIESIAGEYRRYKALGEGAFNQLDDTHLSRRAHGEDNSIATIAWHVSGNLESRFTDFLASDGEKAWRQRDEEFEARDVTQAELHAKWEAGWHVLDRTLASLSDADLTKTVRIRGQALRVHEALHRSLAHTAYHVGQIVYLAKSFRGDAWKTLSIARGRSREYKPAGG